jgi:hypothetical protein
MESAYSKSMMRGRRRAKIVQVIVEVCLIASIIIVVLSLMACQAPLRVMP